MALVPRAAPARRALLPMEDDVAENESLGRRPRLVLSMSAVTPELHAANARFAGAILGTGRYDDAARTVLSDLDQRGEAAAPAVRDLLNQLHGRDPEAATAFAGSVRRQARPQPRSARPDLRPEPAAPVTDWRQTVGHYLLPGQVRTANENFWLETGADIIPIVGNLRSASQAAHEVEETIAAWRHGDYAAFAGHGAMALFNAFGAIPVAGNLLTAARPAIRAALRATPGLRQVHGGWTLAKAVRQFDRKISVSAETLFGKFWSELPPHQKKELKRLQKKITGASGEDYTKELLTSSGFTHQGDGRVWWGNPSGKPRTYDAETAERFRTIFFGLFAVPDKRPGARSLYEVKTAGGKLTTLQKKADAIISDSEDLVYLRQHLDQIPFEFLASQTRRLLQDGGVDFAKSEVDDLIKSMRSARTPEGKPLTAFDWLGTIGRISAESARASEED